MSWLKKVLRNLRSGIGIVAAFLWLCSLVPILVALLVTGVVGAWDLLAWLTKADWRTTEFSIPIFSGIIFLLLIGLNRLILIPLVEWAEGKSSDRNDQGAAFD